MPSPRVPILGTTNFLSLVRSFSANNDWSWRQKYRRCSTANKEAARHRSGEFCLLACTSAHLRTWQSAVSKKIVQYTHLGPAPRRTADTIREHDVRTEIRSDVLGNFLFPVPHPHQLSENNHIFILINMKIMRQNASRFGYFGLTLSKS